MAFTQEKIKCRYSRGCLVWGCNPPFASQVGSKWGPPTHSQHHLCHPVFWNLIPSHWSVLYPSPSCPLSQSNDNRFICFLSPIVAEKILYLIASWVKSLIFSSLQVTQPTCSSGSSLESSRMFWSPSVQQFFSLPSFFFYGLSFLFLFILCTF